MTSTTPHVTSRADVATDNPARYAKQLASHLGRKVPAEETEAGYRLTIGAATCELAPEQDAGRLVLAATAEDAEALTRVQEVVGSHLERFGARDGLVVSWS